MRIAEPLDFYIYPDIRGNVAGRMKSLVASQALYQVEVYVNGLVTQWNRICEDVNTTFTIMAEPSSVPHADAVKSQLRASDLGDLDTHFYLICWDKLDKFFALFGKLQDDPVVSKIVARVGPLLGKAALARHFLEHLHEQLERGNTAPRGRGLSSGGSFSFRYVDKSNKGRLIERLVTLGRAEIQQVIDAYLEILRHFGAKV
jgi:hypothetical protein